VTQPNIDVILPSANGDFVQYTDRDAVLVRPGVPVVDTASANFDTHFDFPVGDPEDPIDVISVVRGWVSATVEMRGREWRFVSTHLEDLDPDVQAGQAAELVAEGGPAAGPGTILVGDINSDAAAGGATYESLIAAGFSDAWSETNPDPGYTWGFDPLDDPSATLTERFDVVLYRDVFSASSARLVGDQTSDMTASGLWPSDHAGVVAILNPAFP
jgi:endonuclease/exonuclease/phosphatase family metal-dependent hydrolase